MTCEAVYRRYLCKVLDALKSDKELDPLQKMGVIVDTAELMSAMSQELKIELDIMLAKMNMDDTIRTLVREAIEHARKP